MSDAPPKKGVLSSLFRDFTHTFVIPAALTGTAGVALAVGAAASYEDFTSVGMLDMVSDRVVTMQNGQSIALSKDFMCRTRTHRCVMDVGDGQLVAFANFDDFMKMRDLLENVLPLRPDIPLEVRPALTLASVMTPFPFEYWVGKADTEATFNPRAFNESTKARGLFQFLPATALETLFYMEKSGQYPQVPETALVERHSIKDKEGKLIRFEFGVAEGVDKTALLEKVLFDPIKSAFMADAYYSRYLRNLDVPENEPITTQHAYIVHWQGGAGGQKLYNAYYNGNPDQLAYPVFAQSMDARIVKDNYPLFIDSNGNPRTIENMLGYISDNRGVGEYEIGDLSGHVPAIQMIDESGSPAHVRANLQEIYVADFNRPIYRDAPLPRARPAQENTPAPAING